MSASRQRGPAPPVEASHRENVVISPDASGVLSRLAQAIASRGVQAHLVGGAVRDHLRGQATGDIDVAVSTDAVALAGVLAPLLGGHLVALEAERGIARVVVPRGSDGSWWLDLTSAEGGIHDDLARRDFAVDAMAVPLEDAAAGNFDAVIDPYGGRADLRDRIIKAVSPSALRADPARLMRAPRLAAQLGFEIEPGTEKQIRHEAHLVASIAPERVRDELLKLLAPRGATVALRRLDGLGLLTRVLPEFEEARGVTQPKEHYWDVFNHLLETAGQVEHVIDRGDREQDFVAELRPAFDSMESYFDTGVSDGHTRLTLLKLAGLLHDVSKPATRTVEPTGRIRFLGHHTEGSQVSERALGRLRMSRKGVGAVSTMVHHHLRPSQMAQKGETPSRKAVYRYYRDVGDVAVDTLYLNLADYLAARGPNLGRQEWAEHCRIVGHILREGLEQKAPQTLTNLLDGHDIMHTFDLRPGPQVGRLVEFVREARASGEITTKDEALHLVEANLDAGGSSGA